MVTCVKSCSVKKDLTCGFCIRWVIGDHDPSNYGGVVGMTA